MKRLISCSVFVLYLFFLSCHTKNRPFLEGTSPSSRQYTDSLATRILSDEGKKFKYFFVGIDSLNGEPHLILQVQGNEFTALTRVAVTSPGKLRNLIKTNGLGYRGCELKGLIVAKNNDATQPGLTYVDLSRIID
jgi:hypothetical protein